MCDISSKWAQSDSFMVRGENSLIANIHVMSIYIFLLKCFPYVGKGLLFILYTSSAPPDDQNHLPQLQSDLIPVA